MIQLPGDEGAPEFDLEDEEIDNKQTSENSESTSEQTESSGSAPVEESESKPETN